MEGEGVLATGKRSQGHQGTTAVGGNTGQRGLIRRLGTRPHRAGGIAECHCCRYAIFVADYRLLQQQQRSPQSEIRYAEVWSIASCVDPLRQPPIATPLHLSSQDPNSKIRNGTPHFQRYILISQGRVAHRNPPHF